MDKQDFRKLDPATQTALRRVAVRMVQAGKTRVEAAAAVEVHPRFVGAWVGGVERFGEAALAGGRRGRQPDEQKALSPDQEASLKRLITDKCPDQLDLPFALWTREAVGMLIERETGIRLSRSTIGGYLHNWRFSPQRPKKRATERREPTVRAWMDRQYPPSSSAPRLRAPTSIGATRPAFPTRPTTAAASPPPARHPSSRDRRHVFPFR